MSFTPRGRVMLPEPSARRGLALERPAPVLGGTRIVDVKMALGDIDSDDIRV